MNKLGVLDDKSAYFLTDNSYRKYFSDVDNDEGFLLKTLTQTYYLADPRYFYALKQKLKSGKIIAVEYKSLETVKNLLKDLVIEKLYIDFDTTTLTQFESYKDLGVQLLNGSKSLSQLRKSKSVKEIESIKKACKIASDAFEYILNFIKAGVTEKSIRNRLVRFMKSKGASGESFDTIVAFGANSAVPHHETGNARLKKDQAVLIDFGCVVDGYCSDMTRTLYYGEPTKEFLEAFNLVSEANLLGEKSAIEGVNAKDVDGVVRDFFAKYGVQDKFTHSLGHGIGLQIHEEPYLSKRGEGKLEENYVFSIEPGLYYDGEFGIRIENTVVIEKGKAKSLTGNGRDLIIIKE